MKARPIERRVSTGGVQVRQLGAVTTIEGHAAVFDHRSQNLGGFVEIVKRGSFLKTLGEADVRATLNHNENFVLGRNTAGTLDLAEDASGLYYRIRPPDTTYARDLMAVMERGDISQSSFSFMTIEDSWGLTEQNFPLRSLNELSLVDVGPVTYPAYLQATSGIGRSAALVGLAKRSGLRVAELVNADAIRSALAGSPATPELAVLLGQADQAIDDALVSVGAADTALDEVLDMLGLLDIDDDETAEDSGSMQDPMMKDPKMMGDPNMGRSQPPVNGQRSNSAWLERIAAAKAHQSDEEARII